MLMHEHRKSLIGLPATNFFDISRLEPDSSGARCGASRVVKGESYDPG
jgi:hypothetical protein